LTNRDISCKFHAGFVVPNNIPNNSLFAQKRGKPMNRIKSFVQKLVSPLFVFLKEKADRDSSVAQQIAHAIPAQCPFARTVNLPFGKQLCIPPLCELNPLYELFAELRFNALCSLADTHHIDISSYI
jgi:hypothetical protein